MMGMPIHMPVSLRDVASFSPPYHHLNLSKLNWDRGVKKANT